MPSRNAIEIVISAVDDASDTIGGIGSSIAGLGKTVAVGAAAIAGATVAIGAGLLDLAKNAAPLQGIQNSFKALAESAGDNSDKLLAAMNKASMGMVSDKDLMLEYNKSAQLVGATLAGQLPDAYQYLAKVAASTGQDTGALFDTLVNGIGRVTPRMLTQLGVTVDAKVANEAYAKSIGKNVDALTKQDKQTALFNATMAALKKNTAAMPDVTENASTKMEQFNIKMENFKDTLGIALLPALSTFMDILSSLADTVMPIITPIITSIDNAMTVFFSAIKDGEDPLTALEQTLYRVFGTGIQPIINFINSIGPSLSSAFASIKEAIDPIIEPIERFIGALIAGVSPGDAIKTLLRDLLPSDIADGIINTFTNIGKILSGLWTVVQPALQALWLWFTQNGLPFILQALADFKANFIDPVITKLGELWGAIKPKFDDLPKTFQEASTAAKELVDMGLFLIFDTLNKAAISATLLAGIIEIVFISALHNLTTAAQGVVKSITDWYNAHKDLVDNIGLFIISIGAAILLMKAYTITTGLASAATGISGLAGAISAAVVGAWAAVTAFAAAAVPVLALAAAIYALVKAYQALQQFQNTAGAAVQNAAGPTQKAILNGLTHDQFMAKAFQSTVDTMGDAAARLFWANNGQAMFELNWQRNQEALRGHALGLKSVPSDGMYLLHKGEEVKTATESQFGGNNGQIAINFYGGNGINNAADAQDAGFMVVNALRQQGVSV